MSAKLIEKYNIPGPRYTSYPTAVEFSPIEATSLEQYLTERNRSPRDISIYIHLPFCASLCWYCGCTTVITRDKSRSDLYLEHLELELKKLSSLLHPHHNVRQVHYGGGTPTFLTPNQLRHLGRLLHRYLNIDLKAEFGVEIDPRSFTEAHLEAMVEYGMNRASLGFQDVNPEVQEAIHRIQPFEMVESAMNLLRKAGISSVNLDVIYGLPKQTRERFARTLDGITALQPDRVAIYSYAHVPWIKPAQKLLEDKELPSPSEKLELLQDAIQYMEKIGFDHIGMDHFARPNDELAVALRDGTLQRNFQGYSTLSGLDLYGLGMSSISSVGRYYFQNEKELDQWQDAVKNQGHAWVRGLQLTREDLLRRNIIMKIMCSRHLNFRDIWEKWYINPKEHFKHELKSLKPFIEDGFVEVHHDGVRILPEGRHFLRNIAMAFDAYLNKKSDTPVYSKTI